MYTLPLVLVLSVYGELFTRGFGAENATNIERTAPASNSTSLLLPIRSRSTSNESLFQDLVPPDIHIGSDRIIQGEPADIKDFPYVVSVQYTKTWEHFCGGSILSPSHVLTACHCLVTRSQRHHKQGRILREPTSITLLAGTEEIYKSKVYSERRYGWHVNIHPKCKKSSSGWANDFGIVTVDYEFLINGVTVRVLPLLKFNNSNLIDEIIEARARCVGVGWGSTKVSKRRNPTYSELLLQVSLRLVPQNECIVFLKRAGITSDFNVQLCTLGKAHQDACQGDSGGPLVCYHNGINHKTPVLL